jgi:ABC-2 type transport system permease protein
MGDCGEGDMKVIYILWLRQVKRYLRSRSRIIGSLGQPLLFLVAFGFGFSAIYQRAGEGNYIQFLAPGIVVMSVLFTAMFSGVEIIWDRQFGFLKETLVAPVSRLEIMLGKTLGGATVAMIQGFIVLGLTYAIGFRAESAHMFGFSLILLFLVAVTFTALGTALASLMEDMQGFQLVMNFLVMPIFFLSGALFPLEGLPKGIDIVTKINPLTYGVDGVRGALIGATHFTLPLDFMVILGFSLALLIIGSYLFSRIQI